MTLHILVEGTSEQKFFSGWLKRINSTHNFRVYHHQGKGALPADFAKANGNLRGLLDLLPIKLKSFENIVDRRLDGVLILVDADNDDPVILERRISEMASQCAPSLRVEVCVATEEMEAFYLGDLKAIENAYPNADMALARQYIPDSICGTWEKFGEVIHDDGGNKVAWAERMGLYVTANPARSRSPSFKAMIRKFSALSKQSAPPEVKRKFHHRAKT